MRHGETIEVPARASGEGGTTGGGSDRPISAVARGLGVHHETLRVWVRQDEVDDGARAARLATVEREELTVLRKEVRDLRRANEILKAASVFSHASSTNPVRGERIHR